MNAQNCLWDPIAYCRGDKPLHAELVSRGNIVYFYRWQREIRRKFISRHRRVKAEGYNCIQADKKLHFDISKTLLIIISVFVTSIRWLEFSESPLDAVEIQVEPFANSTDA